MRDLLLFLRSHAPAAPCTCPKGESVFMAPSSLQENVRALTKGVQAVMGYKPGSGLVTAAAASAEHVPGKPWKKHGNRNKKEKSRRLYRHLDV